MLNCNVTETKKNYSEEGYGSDQESWSFLEGQRRLPLEKITYFTSEGGEVADQAKEGWDDSKHNPEYLCIYNLPLLSLFFSPLFFIIIWLHVFCNPLKLRLKKIFWRLPLLLKKNFFPFNFHFPSPPNNTNLFWSPGQTYKIGCLDK